MVWIPPQQKSTTHYIRWTIVSTFVIFMLWLISYFYDEYQQAEVRKHQAKVEIANIEEHNAKVDATKALEPPHQTKTYKKGGKVHKTIEESPQPVQQESKIEIDAGLLKVAMSNEASWMAIFKIIFTVLFTFFGIRLINFGFKKLENEPKLT